MFFAVHSHLLVYPTPAVPHPPPEAFFESAPAPTSAPNVHPLFFVFCLHLITRICKNIKNSLIHLRDKILLGERLLIETMKDKLKNIVQIEHTRHRSIGRFAANLMAAMAA